MAAPSSGPAAAAVARPALTVFLMPAVHAEDILAVLVDYAAAGMLTTFAWVEAGAASSKSVRATMVRDGRSEPVALQQLLTAQRYDRVRVAVLVPVDAPPATRVSLTTEQALEHAVRTASMGAKVTLLRLLVTADAGSSTGPDPALVLEGWHNLLIAPEDSPGPGLGSTVVDGLTDPLELARHVGPVICGVAGIWAGIETTPFDTLEVLPGQTIRAVRGFYRHLDTAAVEGWLRTQLFGPTGRLPLPHGGQVPVVYVEDPRQASQSMARALWTKHRDVLRGTRLSVESPAIHAVSVWTAVKMFLTFLAVALRRAPSAFLSSAVGSVSSKVATTVQTTVFGASDSAFAVVTGQQAGGWQELGRSADAMSTSLGGQPDGDHPARPNLSPLWSDFIDSALTLADGGRRAAGLEPIAVGAAVGVMRAPSDVAPGATERFSLGPASLAAVIGMEPVEPADVLGAATLRERLQRAYTDPVAGVEARHAVDDLDGWQAHRERSYTWQVAAILADFLGRTRVEVTTLMNEIRAVGKADSENPRLRRRQHTIGLVLKTFGWALFISLAVLCGAAGLHWLTWRLTLTCGGAFFAVYSVLALALFLLVQRDVFAETNLRESREGELEAKQANLRSALQDLSRLSMAYGQLMAWSRAVGALLDAPFGELRAANAPPASPLTGLPRSTQMAVADPPPDQARTALHTIEARLYRLGWLTRPWQQLMTLAAGESRDDPATLLALPGVGTGSALDRWSSALATGEVTPGGAAALWEGVERMLDDPASRVGEELTGTVVLSDGTRVAAGEFGAGMTQNRSGVAAPFDASLFTHTAATAGSSSVAIDSGVVARRGLGYRAAVIQASDGLPAYHFAVAAPPMLAPTTSSWADQPAADDDVPPDSSGLVF